MLISDKMHAALVTNAALGGKAASRKMTQEQKSARASAGALAVASKMTAEERSTRARNAALAKHAKKNKVGKS